jgi:hypothetical protein
VHGAKFDGYCTQILVVGKTVTVRTRRDYDWSDRFRDIAKAVAILPDCILDGEAVVLNSQGRTDLGALQSALASGKTKRIVHFAFDLIFMGKRTFGANPCWTGKRPYLDFSTNTSSGFVTAFATAPLCSTWRSYVWECVCQGLGRRRIEQHNRSLSFGSDFHSLDPIGGWRETAGGIHIQRLLGRYWDMG